MCDSLEKPVSTHGFFSSPLMSVPKCILKLFLKKQNHIYSDCVYVGGEDVVMWRAEGHSEVGSLLLPSCGFWGQGSGHRA